MSIQLCGHLEDNVCGAVEEILYDIWPALISINGVGTNNRNAIRQCNPKGP